tara:strand:+ start:515 stop:6394 length:5880 start_codon:yes stop_codon:yes gene_type:complete
MGDYAPVPDVAAMYQRPLSTPSPMEEQQALAKQTEISGPMNNQLTIDGEAGVLEKLGGAAMSGLEFVGNALDTLGGARAIRGAAVGKPREALTLGPGGMWTDYLGVTKKEDYTSGRDVLEKWGVLDKNEEGLDWGDVGGFLFEVITDPLTYFGPGILKGGLKVLSAGGKAVGKSFAKNVVKGAAKNDNVAAALMKASGKGDEASQIFINTFDAGEASIRLASKEVADASPELLDMARKNLATTQKAHELSMKGVRLTESQLAKRIKTKAVISKSAEVQAYNNAVGKVVPDKLLDDLSEVLNVPGRSSKLSAEEILTSSIESLYPKLDKPGILSKTSEVMDQALAGTFEFGVPTLFTGANTHRGIRKGLFSWLPEKAKMRTYDFGLDTKIGKGFDKYHRVLDQGGKSLRGSGIGVRATRYFNPKMLWDARTIDVQEEILDHVSRMEASANEARVVTESMRVRLAKTGALDVKEVMRKDPNLTKAEALEIVEQNRDAIGLRQEGWELNEAGMPVLPAYDTAYSSELKRMANANKRKLRELSGQDGFDEAGLRSADAAYSNIIKRLEQADAAGIEAAVDEMRKISRAGQLKGIELGMPTSVVAGRVSPKLPSALADLKTMLPDGKTRTVEQELDILKEMGTKAFDYAKKQGIRIEALDDAYALYDPRTITKTPRRSLSAAWAKGKANRNNPELGGAAPNSPENLNPFTGRQQKRQDSLRGIKGGTWTLNRWFKKYGQDEFSRAPKGTLERPVTDLIDKLAKDEHWVDAAMDEEYLLRLMDEGTMLEVTDAAAISAARDAGELFTGIRNGEEILVTVDKGSPRIVAIAQMLAEGDPDVAGKGMRIYSADPLKAATSYYDDVMRAGTAAELVGDIAASHAFHRLSAGGIDLTSQSNRPLSNLQQIFSELDMDTTITKRRVLRRFMTHNPEEWASMKAELIKNDGDQYKKLIDWLNDPSSVAIGKKDTVVFRNDPQSSRMEVEDIVSSGPRKSKTAVEAADEVVDEVVEVIDEVPVAKPDYVRPPATETVVPLKISPRLGKDILAILPESLKGKFEVKMPGKRMVLFVDGKKASSVNYTIKELGELDAALGTARSTKAVENLRLDIQARINAWETGADYIDPFPSKKTASVLQFNEAKVRVTSSVVSKLDLKNFDAALEAKLSSVGHNGKTVTFTIDELTLIDGEMDKLVAAGKVHHTFRNKHNEIKDLIKKHEDAIASDPNRAAVAVPPSAVDGVIDASRIDLEKARALAADDNNVEISMLEPTPDSLSGLRNRTANLPSAEEIAKADPSHPVLMIKVGKNNSIVLDGLKNAEAAVEAGVNINVRVLKPEHAKDIIRKLDEAADNIVETADEVVDAIDDVITPTAPSKILADDGIPEETMVYLAGLDEPIPLRLLEHAEEIPTSLLEDGGFTKVFEDMIIDPEIGDDLKRYLSSFVKHDVKNELWAAASWFTDLFKQYATSFWPAFHVRNAVSGFVNNMYGGAFDPDQIGPMRWIKPYFDAMRLRKGKGVKGLSELDNFKGRGLTDEAASQEMIDVVLGEGTLGPGQHGSDVAQEGSDVVGNFLNSNDSVIPSIYDPAVDAVNPNKSTRQRFTEALEISEDELGTSIPGVRQVGRGIEKVRAVGYQLGNETEFYLRMAPVIAYLRRGMSLSEAITKVKLTQVDYTALSQYERHYLRRIIPFYTFTRRQIPFVLEELSNPSSGMSMVTKGITRAKHSMEDPSQPIPEWISGGISLPLGKTDAGLNRYLTNVGGLAGGAEDVFNLLKPGHGIGSTILKTLGGLAARSNPLAQMPIEGITGYSFWNERPFSELKSPTARLIGQVSESEQLPKYPSAQLDALIGRLPGYNRFVSTARSITDSKRRPIWGEDGNVSVANVLARVLPTISGVRITDTDVGRSRNSILQKRMEEILSRNPNVSKFSKMYIPENKLGSLSQEELEAYMIYKKLGSEASKASYARRKAAAYSN